MAIIYLYIFLNKNKPDELQQVWIKIAKVK